MLRSHATRYQRYHGEVPNCRIMLFSGRTVPFRWGENKNELYFVLENVFPQFSTPPPCRNVSKIEFFTLSHIPKRSFPSIWLVIRFTQTGLRGWLLDLYQKLWYTGLRLGRTRFWPNRCLKINNRKLRYLTKVKANIPLSISVTWQHVVMAH